MERITIDASRKYDVVVENGAFEKIGDLSREVLSAERVCLVADETTSSLFGARAEELLLKSGFEVLRYTVEVGETSKSPECYIGLLNFLAENRLTRSDALVALGGGVVGDLTGFAAATYLRGIQLIQIPTTLLSAVDSSVGGKTAINLAEGKNLAGAFYQPSLVICDTGIIRALPGNVFSDGMAEVIKYGMIRSENVLSLCHDGAEKNLEGLVSECVKIKRDVVSKDEFDRGLRGLLNFGHTPAHAVEKLSEYKISHGSAVAIGMCVMTRAAERLGMCADLGKELSELLGKYSLPTSCPFAAEEMYQVILSDKKRSGESITLVVPKKRGECVLKKVSLHEAEEFIKLGVKA